MQKVFELFELRRDTATAQNEQGFCSFGRCFIFSCIFGLVLIVVAVAVVALLALGVLKLNWNQTDGTNTTGNETKKETGGKNDSEVMSIKLTEHAIFPNGTFGISIAQFKPGPKKMAPLSATLEELTRFGLRLDNSSFIAEVGRQSFLFVRLPAANVENGEQRNSSDVAEENTTRIAYIGIRFGSAEKIHLVPLSLAKVAQSGLEVVFELPDKSILYQLKVLIWLQAKRSSGCEKTSCTMSTWTPYSVVSDGETGTTGQPTVMPISCGPQCDQN